MEREGRLSPFLTAPQLMCVALALAFTFGYLRANDYHELMEVVDSMLRSSEAGLRDGTAAGERPQQARGEVSHSAAAASARVGESLGGHASFPGMLPAMVSAVVVPGAWRLSENRLSRAFRVRIEDGLRYALLFGAGTMVLTGGRNDSLVAQEHLLGLDVANVFGVKEDGSGGAGDGAREFVASVPAELRPRMDSMRRWLLSAGGRSSEGGSNVARALLGEVLRESRRRGSRSPLTIVTENNSTTTAENAVFAADALARHIAALPSGPESLAAVSQPLVLVVSSPYHMRRCKVLFSRYLPQHRVLVVPAVSEWEFEVDFPPRNGIWVSIDLDNLPIPITLTQRGLSRVSWLLPRWLRWLSLSSLYSFGRIKLHARGTVMSISAVSYFREVAALVANVVRGDMGVWDVFFHP